LEVQNAIHDIADIGVAIIVASTNVEELIATCDRIALMADGRITKTVDKPSFSAEKLKAALKA
jgi:ABC-type sugar transport system ATPase subunit